MADCMEGSVVACGPAVESLENREARSGLSEAGTYADNDDNDCKAGLTAIEPPTDPLTNPPKFDVAVTPATIELSAADNSGSRVAEGLVETLDNKEEIEN